MTTSHHSGPIAALVTWLCTACVIGTAWGTAPPSTPSSVLPKGGTVASGQVSITQSQPLSLTVVQTSNTAVVNWNSFSVGQLNSVDFVQPSATSAILNRVTGPTSSTIAGDINASGQVFLINPNGIAITKSGNVQVGGGFVASTLALSDANFNSGNWQFQGNGASAAVSNSGTITAAPHGSVALLGGTVVNAGAINVPLGRIGLGSGEQATLDINGGGFLQVAVPTGATAANGASLIDVSGSVRAAGGQVVVAAATVSQAIHDAVNVSGTVSAASVSGQDGSIYLEAGAGGSIAVSGQLQAHSMQLQGAMVVNTGSIDASGTSGGAVAIDTGFFGNYGNVSARGTRAGGGSITVAAPDTGMLQSATAALDVDGVTAGGKISIDGNAEYLSGDLSAKASAGLGGTLSVTGGTVALVGAALDASGTSGGGAVRVGGDLHGSGPLPNATTTKVSATTTIAADATVRGNGGSVVVWSSNSTSLFGNVTARGGAAGGNGGSIEISSQNSLTFGGIGNAAAPKGITGTLLLDPKNIVIDNSGSASGNTSQIQLIDPLAGSGDLFGSSVLNLPNGNVVVAAPGTTVGGAADAGAIYVFNGTTGALISALTGSHAQDNLGLLEIGGYKYYPAELVQLTNGNFVVEDPSWNGNAGSVTWGSATTGVSGIISAANSLVGTHAGDAIGATVNTADVTALNNGNYLVFSPSWNGSAGAVTWGNGSNGTLANGTAGGAVSASNSLINTGTVNLVQAPNGTALVYSAAWNNNTGAATWINGANGQLADGTFGGIQSTANSLTGTVQSETQGQIFNAVVVGNGNFALVDSGWSDQRGAVTWINGATGLSGLLSASNSLVGTTAGDQLGEYFPPTSFAGAISTVTVLNNGNYVVGSPAWNSNAGAATWVNGANGHLVDGAVAEAVSATNSLIGSSSDQVGTNVTALPNGNYVVGSPLWHNSTGAATLGNGLTGQLPDGTVAGFVSVTNSLTGATPGDLTGAVITPVGMTSDLTTFTANGDFLPQSDNYLVASTAWSGGKGAVTWVNGVTGNLTSGGYGHVVSAANSLVGSSATDNVGGYQYQQLYNGNVVITDPFWNNNTGAVTWMNGATGHLADGTLGGVISASNSLVGSHAGPSCSTQAAGAGDCVGFFGDQPVGLLSEVQGTTLAYISGIAPLPNGNYVVASPLWNGGRGAVTWGNGATGLVGVVSSGNSLVGSTPGYCSANTGDCVGGGFGGPPGYIYVLPNSNYVVDSPDWNNSVGAITFGSGTQGVSGVISAANSFVGSLGGSVDAYGNYDRGDSLGSGGVVALTNGNYVVSSPNWSTPGYGGVPYIAGAVTWFNGTNGNSTAGQLGGVLSAANSLIGGPLPIDALTNGVYALPNGNYYLSSPTWGANTGEVTLGNGTTGSVGVVSAANSLVGSRCTADMIGGGGCSQAPGCQDRGYGAPDCIGGAGSGVQSGVYVLPSGNLLVNSPLWNDGAGAVTFVNSTTGVVGPVSAANSTVGASAGAGLTIAYAGALGPELIGGAPIIIEPSVSLVSISSGNTANLSYAQSPGQTVTVSASQLAANLATGTSVTLQASNDITVNSAVTVPGATGGILTLDAGRSIVLNAGLSTANGNLLLNANANLADGVIDGQRDPGAAVITQASGASIDAGSGAVSINLLPGLGKTNSTSGAITLGSIAAGTLSVENSGISAGSDVVLSTGSLLSTRGGSGASISLSADNGIFVNNAGPAALQTGTGAYYAVFSDGVTDTTLDGLIPAQSIFGATLQQFQTQTASLTGNTVFYRGQGKVLDVTADSYSRLYGDANPTFGYSITGYLGTDTSSILSGAPLLSSTATSRSSVGVDPISISLGTLSNSAGYAFDLISGTLTITPRPLTYTTANTTSIYGTAGGPLTTLNGVLFGDSVSPTLGLTNAGNAVTLGPRTAVGSYAEMVTSLSNPNYVVATGGNSLGTLTIDPLAVTYSVANTASTYGTMAASAATLTGVLAGDAVTAVPAVSAANGAAVTLSARTSVGSYVETVSGLSGAAAGNYVLSPTGDATGTLTINPLAITYGVANATSTYGTLAAPGAATLNGVLAGDAVAPSVLVAGADGAPVTLKPRTGAGSYVETVSGLSGAAAGNYLLSGTGNTAGSLTIDPLAITFSVTNSASTYGSLATPGVASLNGVLAGDTVSPTAVAITGTNGAPLTLAARTSAGNYGEVVTGLDGSSAANYTIASSGNAPGTLIIDPLAITYSVANATSFYGSLATLGSATLNGVLAGDAVTASVGVTNGAGSPVPLTSLTPAGSYAEVVTGLSGASAGDYSVQATGDSPGILKIDSTNFALSPSWYDVLRNDRQEQTRCLAQRSIAGSEADRIHDALTASGSAVLLSNAPRAQAAGACKRTQEPTTARLQ